MTNHILEKVTTFITRDAGTRRQVLLFQHEYAGIQIPAGTVEIGEDAVVAARREASEESGLRALSAPRLLAVRNQPAPGGYCYIYTTTAVYARPYAASFDWARLRNGIVVREERRSGDFVQITYSEHDREADPPFVSYQITGWAPVNALAWRQRRYFFILDCLEKTPESWSTTFDGPRFTLFWADLHALPPIVSTQAAWMDVLLAHIEDDEPTST